MELDLGPEIAQFRAEIRDWIAGHTPAGLTELSDWNNVVTTGGYGSERRAKAMAHPLYAEWERELAAAGACRCQQREQRECRAAHRSCRSPPGPLVLCAVLARDDQHRPCRPTVRHVSLSIHCARALACDSPPWGTIPRSMGWSVSG